MTAPVASIPERLAALDRACEILRCPTCHGSLHRDERSLRCSEGHDWNIAKQGHVNLLGHGAPANADSAEMIAARERFLESGAYAPIREALSDAASAPDTVVEVGAGTGYYLRGMPGRVKLATDVSALACRAAARSGLAAVVADTWAGLPVADASVDALLCVFAPRNPAEFARVLAPSGRALVATPTPRHLAELRAAHQLMDIERGKLDRLDGTMVAAGLRLAERRELEFTIGLDAASRDDLVGMGPNAFHASSMSDHEGAADEIATAMASVDVSVFERP